MAALGSYPNRIWTCPYRIGESESLFGRARIREDLAVCDNSYERRKHEFGKSECHFLNQGGFQPFRIFIMPVRIATERINQNISIDKYQKPSILSARDELLSKSTPGKRPPFPLFGSLIRRVFRATMGPPWTHDANASSTTAVKDFCSSNALRFTWLRSAWLSRIVVLIHQNIPELTSICQVWLSGGNSGFREGGYFQAGFELYGSNLALGYSAFLPFTE